MTDSNDLAIELALLKAIGDHVKRLSDERKAVLAESIRRGTVYARLGEEDLATVVLVPERSNWAVVDRAAFVDWCLVNRPSSVIPAVRASDERAILDGIKKDGLVPDGVAETPVNGYVQVKQTPAQVEAMWTASAEGRLVKSAAQVLELES